LGVVKQLLNHIQRHKLCKISDKILLAVSGGIDSMVMLDLFRKSGFSFGVAHCNFQLRGEESNEDETLVRTWCQLHTTPFYSSRFQTATIAAERKVSIQVTARDLRYEFFREILSGNGYNFIATAHNLNDNLETILLNLTRGTGIFGLRGIPVSNDAVIRPMLFASRGFISTYASENNIAWREDSSNKKDDYDRNFVRQHIIPKLRELNPALETTFKDSIDRISGMMPIAAQALKGIKGEICKEEGGRVLIHKASLFQLHYPDVILWEMLKERAFNSDQCKDIVAEHQAGKRFYAGKWVLTVDRDHFIVESIPNDEFSTVLIDRGQTDAISSQGKLKLQEVEAKIFVLKKQYSRAQLDLQKLQFPLQWRPWKAGDVFKPLGMRSQKKISDLLIDEKIPLSDKNKVTVLESAGEIVWVVGIRINDAYKVTEGTERVLVIERIV
jgi:tRNA(Ile)-lysidine synthase